MATFHSDVVLLVDHFGLVSDPEGNVTLRGLAHDHAFQDGRTPIAAVATAAMDPSIPASAARVPASCRNCSMVEPRPRWNIAMPKRGWAPPWPQAAELARAFPSEGWTLVGGLMVQLHSVHAGLPRSRPTVDVDMILHIETGATTFPQAKDTLECIPELKQRRLTVTTDSPQRRDRQPGPRPERQRFGGTRQIALKERIAPFTVHSHSSRTTIYGHLDKPFGDATPDAEIATATSPPSRTPCTPTAARP